MFFVGTGTAANALSLTLANRPAASASAIARRMRPRTKRRARIFHRRRPPVPVDGPAGRIDPASLDRAIARYPAEFVHSGRPIAVSITQSTEIGTVYGLDDIDAIAAICRKARLPLHMDGARFANALVSLDVTPAEMTWKRGVDVLSFGGTKNGCWCAEAIVLFDPAQAAEMAFIRKRAAQLYSKSRFIAAQFHAYFEDGLWLEPRATPIRLPPGWPAASANPGRCGSPGSPRPTRSSRSWQQREGTARPARAPCSSAGTRRNSIAASSPATNRSRGSSPASRPLPKTSTRSAI